MDRHLNAENLLHNLGRRAVSGGVLTAAAQAFKFALYLGTAIVLARLLSPKDFGLVAMAGALTPLLRAFREGGLSTATVQKQDITHAQVSNLFWINLGLGGAVALVGAALAPLVAWFYRDERVTVVTVLLSSSFLLSGAAVQHLAVLNRHMRFKAISAIDIVSGTAGFVVGVVMAVTECGYWSLVGMQLTITVVELGLAWFLSGWRPQGPRRGIKTKPLVQFGASMTMDAFFRRLASGTDVILLGRMYGADAVGLYSRAQALLLRPIDQFITPFDVVFIPILSRLQDNAQRYRQVFVQAYGAIALMSFTFAGLLMGLSAPLVVLLLGERWSAVIPIFAWLTIAALYIPMSYAAVWLLTTQGRSRDVLKLGIVVPVLTLLSVAIGVPFGPVGMALSFSLMGVCLRLPIQYYITGASGPVTRQDLFGVFLRHLPLWAAAATPPWLIQKAAPDWSPLTQLVCGSVAGGILAIVTIFLWPSLRAEATFMLQQGREFIRRKRNKSGPTDAAAA